MLIGLAAAFLLMLLAQPAMAQSQYISGTVIDSTGASIPDAAVRIQDAVKGGPARQVNTDQTGRFQVIDLEPGRYTITVEKNGFRKSEVTVTLDVNTKLDVGAVKLAVGNITDVVSVEADATPVVTTNTMDKSYIVDKTQITELPMNGRNFTSLMSTVPGMTSAAQSDFNVNFNDVSQFHSLGGRGSENNMYLDGSPNIDVGDNQSQYTQASVDTIAEFRVLQSGFNAEYGRNSGMVIAVQTKSGGSQFHGTLYEYLRNNYFDAKCVLCNGAPPQLRYNQFGGNFSGWVPLPKISTKSDKRMFFFYNREMTRRNLPGSGQTDIPDAQILEQGNFSQWLLSTNMTYAPNFKNGTVFEPGTVTRDGAGNITGGIMYPNNTVPQSVWQPLAANMLKIYTGIPGYASLAPTPGDPGYVRYFFNNPDQLIKNQDMLRFDYNINSKMTSFFRWVNDYQKETIQNGIWTGEPFPMQPQARPKPGSSWAWNLVTTFTPTVASETILSYNHQSQSLSVVGNNPISRSALGADFAQIFPATNITNSVPDVSAGAINFSLGDPGWHNWGKDYAATENLSWVKGGHNFKFGVFFNRDDKAQTGNWGMEGNINFNGNSTMTQDTGNGLANLMLGNFSSYTNQSAAIFPYFRFWEFDAYAQDNWKVTKRLTIDYGIRFVHMTPTYTVVRGGTPGGEGTFTLYSVDLSKYSKSNAPVINTTTGAINGYQPGFIEANPVTALGNLGMICDPCSGTNPGFSPAKSFPEPRLGLAYDLTGDGKTALRAGAALFNERLRQNTFSFGAGAQFPNLFSGTVYNQNVANFSTNGVGSATSPIQPPGMTIWPTDNTMPSIYSWYAGLQRELPYKFALDLSYSGSHSIHLMDQRAVNALPAGYFLNNNLSASVNGWTSALLPYAGWGNLTAIETLGYSSYNAMMVRVSRRFANNFEVNMDYTWSHVLDTGDNDSDNINNPFCIACMYANAGYNQPDVFSIDAVYDLPKITGSFANAVTKQVFNGWELSGVFRAQSGMPFNVTSNGGLYGENIGNNGGQFANLVGDPYASGAGSLVLNHAAFFRPADGTWGTLGRNALHLPAITNLDMALLKNFAITPERVKMTFRFEVYNLFNHPELWGINTGFSGDNPGAGLSAGDGQFGQPNAYRDARTIQLALRLAF
ncbi:MAG TPA: carboxypeptidase regulatory-like domain-containing protein [Bryobacteraceae bacterium]|nr:carboxypeptidase regulatory-like domain-containing protein [Bryobacteraceae bacterium]